MGNEINLLLAPYVYQDRQRAPTAGRGWAEKVALDVWRSVVKSERLIAEEYEQLFIAQFDFFLICY